jgi:hypothetical protein
MCQGFPAVYIGQTERTVRSRVIEHIKGRSSHVRLHMSTHDPNSFTAIKWKILISVSDTIAHQATESLFIRQESNLMNGCEGMDILPILQS